MMDVSEIQRHSSQTVPGKDKMVFCIDLSIQSVCVLASVCARDTQRKFSLVKRKMEIKQHMCDVA